MSYKAFENILQRTMDWLQKGNDAQSWWIAYTESAEMCLFEMTRMSQPVADPSHGLDQASGIEAPRQALLGAVPHVRTMVAAMRKKDRGAALKSGHEALAEMKPAL
jgi:hypothetical protein